MTFQSTTFPLNSLAGLVNGVEDDKAGGPDYAARALTSEDVAVSIDLLFPNGVLPYLAGGICIGLAVSLIFVLTGQVAGMSSVFSSCWSWFSRRAYFQQPRMLASRVWRLWLALGLVGGAALYWFGFGPGIPWQTQVPLWQLGVGGFIAGFGARLGNGCTSGHGICGMASLQGLSFLSVMVFLSVAILTANLVAVYGGGQ